MTEFDRKHFEHLTDKQLVHEQQVAYTKAQELRNQSNKTTEGGHERVDQARQAVHEAAATQFQEIRTSAGGVIPLGFVERAWTLAKIAEDSRFWKHAHDVLDLPAERGHHDPFIAGDRAELRAEVEKFQKREKEINLERELREAEKAQGAAQAHLARVMQK